MLRVESLRKRFGEVVALDDCSFTVDPGQMLGFLGPNGAGKTTAMRAIFGLVRPDAGAVTWDGEPITTSVRRRFGYMPEERGLYPKMRVRDQLVYLARLHGMDRAAAQQAVDHWLGVFDLGDRARSKVTELSHGNQQRVQLIAALVHDPPALILDEPFSGLDPIAAHTMAEVLRATAEAGTAVLFSSHQLDMVEGLCREVAIINEGRVILTGDVDRLRAALPRRYLDVVFADGGDPARLLQLPAVAVVEQHNDHIRLQIEDDADVQALAAAVTAAGDVTQFSFEPPPLSEVFREAVKP
jgi:ABC-2 type transport system ATP-binding protein